MSEVSFFEARGRLMSADGNYGILENLETQLRVEDEGVLRELLPGFVERFGLFLAVLGAISTVIFAFMGNASSHRMIFGVGGICAMATSAIVFMVSLSIRSLAEFVKMFRNPMKHVEGRYQKYSWAARSLEHGKASATELEWLRRFVMHQSAIISGRLGFLVGGVRLVGIVPGALAAWWAWRTAGSPTQFAFPEKMLISFSAGAYAGLLLVQSRIETLARIEFVLSEVLRRKGISSYDEANSAELAAGKGGISEASNRKEGRFVW